MPRQKEWTRAAGTRVEMLLHHQHLTLQDGEVVEAALQQYRAKPSVGFSDCLVLETARKAGHVPLGTFDKALSRADGAQRL
jgi:predicted nucleic-acid-binding protein